MESQIAVLPVHYGVEGGWGIAWEKKKSPKVEIPHFFFNDCGLVVAGARQKGLTAAASRGGDVSGRTLSVDSARCFWHDCSRWAFAGVSDQWDLRPKMLDRLDMIPGPRMVDGEMTASLAGTVGLYSIDCCFWTLAPRRYG